jgi:hypothetical protein
MFFKDIDRAFGGGVLSRVIRSVHCTVEFIWRILCLCLRAKIRKFVLWSQKNLHKVTLNRQSHFRNY